MASFWKYSVLLLCIPPSAASAASPQLVGNWKNIDPATRGVVQVVIDDTDSGGIRVFGACHPNPCPWGRADLVTYGGDIDDANQKIGLARFHPSFADQDIVVKLRDDNTLRLETFTRFTDGSGRKNYSQTSVFQKVGAAASAP